jgi:SAM-dependent methyltransferase
MMSTQPELIVDPSNAGMVGAWDGDEGAFWASQARRFDESFAALHGAFLAAAAIGADDIILDVGCGTGQTTRDVARLARNGAAVGVDLSSDMLALARKIAANEGVDNVEFLHADAQIHAFASAEFDAVISRLGSMFFGDPVAAFTNIHRAMCHGGRLVLLTWQNLAENEWLTEFRRALAVGRDLPTPQPNAPSPFALADPARVRAILGDAGFVDLTFEELRAPMSFGPNVDDAFEFVISVYGWMRDGLDDAGRVAADDALRRTIAEHASVHGAAFQSATWIVRAHKF